MPGPDQAPGIHEEMPTNRAFARLFGIARLPSLVPGSTVLLLSIEDRTGEEPVAFELKQA
jgi:hypothetical protein